MHDDQQAAEPNKSGGLDKMDGEPPVEEDFSLIPLMERCVHKVRSVGRNGAGFLILLESKSSSEWQSELAVMRAAADTFI